MRRKKRLQLWIEPELEAEILDVLARYHEGGKRVGKNDLCVRLIRDGFRFWAREDQVSNRLESTLARVMDDVSMTRAMQNALAFRSLGEDEAVFHEYLALVARMKEEADGA